MEVYIGVKLKCLVLCLIQFTLVYGITFSYVPLSWVSCLNADILFFPPSTTIRQGGECSGKTLACSRRSIFLSVDAQLTVTWSCGDIPRGVEAGGLRRYGAGQATEEYGQRIHYRSL